MHVPQCWQMLLVEYVPNVLYLLFRFHSILQSSYSRIGFEWSRCWVRCRLYTPKGMCHIYWYKAAYFVMAHCGGCKRCRGCYPENIVATRGNWSIHWPNLSNTTCSIPRIFSRMLENWELRMQQWGYSCTMPFLLAQGNSALVADCRTSSIDSRTCCSVQSLAYQQSQ